MNNKVSVKYQDKLYLQKGLFSLFLQKIIFHYLEINPAIKFESQQILFLKHLFKKYLENLVFYLNYIQSDVYNNKKDNKMYHYSQLKRQQQNHSNSKVYYDGSGNHNLSLSKITPNSTLQYQVKLPPMSQPMLSKYRGQKFKQNLFKTQVISLDFFNDLLCGKSNQNSISMCQKCQKSDHLNLCKFILALIQQKYDWNRDNKFKSTYQNYTAKRIHVFLTDQEISHRIQSKFNILGVILLQNHKLLLTRIIKNYIKHTIYYGYYEKLTLQNDLYFWFLAGIYYHIGVPKYFNELQSLPKYSVGPHELLMFWMLQIVMKRLSDCTEQKLSNISKETLQFCQQFYKKQFQTLSRYHVNLGDIFSEWTNQLMMGLIGIQFIGFYIKSILKQGFSYPQKTMLSYFQRMVSKLQNQEIISLKNPIFQNGKHNFQTGKQIVQTEQQKNNKKQQITKALLDSNEEWPGIFFNTSVFDFN